MPSFSSKYEIHYLSHTDKDLIYKIGKNKGVHSSSTQLRREERWEEMADVLPLSFPIQWNSLGVWIIVVRLIKGTIYWQRFSNSHGPKFSLVRVQYYQDSHKRSLMN